MSTVQCGADSEPGSEPGESLFSLAKCYQVHLVACIQKGAGTLRARPFITFWRGAQWGSLEFWRVLTIDCLGKW